MSGDSPMGEVSPKPRVSVVIPVKDGERYLAELLDALARERPDQVLVIDSGSRDRSLEIVRAAGVELLEIDPAEFSHGPTRNLGAEHTTGELICFLTQDATPCPGWLAAYCEAFALEERVGAAYGPHLPRADTSPMIARELTEFFATFEASTEAREEAGGKAIPGPVVQRRGGPTFLSNVNACYARACWQELRFREALLLRGPGVRRRPAGGRLEQGLRPRGGRAARARLQPDGVHAALLRRVPRAALLARPRRADRSPQAGRRSAGARRRRRALDGRTRLRPRRARTLDAALAHTPHRTQSVLGAGLALGPPAAATARASVVRGQRLRSAVDERPCASERTGGRRARGLRECRPTAHDLPSGPPHPRARVRADRPDPRRGAGAAVRSNSGYGRPLAAAPSVRDPALLRGQRRAQHHLPADAPARAGRSHLLGVGR